MGMKLLLTLAVTTLLLPSSNAEITEDQKCIIVIDAGSSGSRLQIYHMAKSSLTPKYNEFEAPDGVDFKLEPGISSQTPDEGAAAITQLLDVAANYIPSSLHKNTGVYMGATAGMRLLSADFQNKRWFAIRDAIEDSPFFLGVADTLSGEEEALFGWLAVNWLAHAEARETHSEPTPFNSRTYGSLDLGGASTQAAFLPDVSVLENKLSLKLAYGEEEYDYSLYLNSWMRSGQDQARLRALRIFCKKRRTCESPCDVAGHEFTVDLSSYGGKKNVQVNGTGDWDSCYETVKKNILHLNWECLFGEDCAMHARYFPRLPQNSIFYGYAAFFYAMNGIGGVNWSDDSTSDLSQFMSLGQQWCAGQGSKSGADLTEDAGYSAQYCFTSAYSYAILVDAYGFEPNPQGNDAKVIITRKVGGVSASWALGMALYHGQADTAGTDRPQDRRLRFKGAFKTRVLNFQP